MPRTFAYVRVSTSGQTTDNQLQGNQAAGFSIEPRRAVTETISGSGATAPGATHEISCWLHTGFAGYPARILSM